MTTDIRFNAEQLNSLPAEFAPLVDAFSDWRIYAAGLDESSGLPAGKIGGDDPLDMRPWVSFDALDVKLQQFVSILRDLCLTKQSWASFKIDFISGSQHFRFRGQEMGGFFACKKIPTDPPDIRSLPSLSSVREFISRKDIMAAGGLLLMSGEAGTGKTTTATAVVRERLRLYGGYCLAMADPLEQPIAEVGGRRVGINGYVDEVDVSEIGYRQGLIHSFRSFPVRQKGMLFYGEIRSDSNAADILNIACDGRDVHSTMHAKSADAVIERVLASAVLGGLPINNARSLLAQSLCAVVHHKIRYGQFEVKIHVVTSEVAAAIRDGQALPFQSAAQVK